MNEEEFKKELDNIIDTVIDAHLKLLAVTINKAIEDGVILGMKAKNPELLDKTDIPLP